ncbi:MAG: hypothetical protein AAFR99_14965 [Cyanobacteria bacterium J06629_9]
MALKPKEPANEKGEKARQLYLEMARAVVGEANLGYESLYQRFAENDWAAIKLDSAVALRGLQAGHSPRTVVGMLHQSPYMQHQVHQKKVPLAPMSQYARSTVAKLANQLESARAEKSRSQSRSSEIEL